MDKPRLPENTQEPILYYSGRLLSGLVMAFIFFPMLGIAQGNLLIMPRRVVFDGSKRYEELNLANTGRDTSRYVISLVHYRMKDNGGFEEIMKPDSGQSFADKWLRFFPHSVVLGPGESQVIKIQLSRSNELVEGEYRSHIYFRAIPDTRLLGEKETVHDSSSISVRLVPVFGISIPVIIHIGESTTKTTLKDLSLEIGQDTIPALTMTFLRTGNRSVYGDISVDYLTTQGKSFRVGDVRGIAVYTPIPLRRFRMELENIRGVNYHSGKLHIVYTTPADSKQEILAEAEIILH
ncbi:fimbrial biogenesis chaperone [Flavitalea flava]